MSLISTLDIPTYPPGTVPPFKIAGIDHPDIGFLALDCDQGYCTTTVEIGHPEVREVSQHRTQADGSWDTTRYFGSRAVTVTVIADTTIGPHLAWSELVDAMRLYMHPSLRPWLWVRRVPDAEPFRIQVRTTDAPYTIETRERTTIVWSFVAPTGIFEAGGDPTCGSAFGGAANEPGRAYDLHFDRVYPPSAGLGLFTARVRGNVPTDWVARIYGPCTSPQITNETWNETFALTASGGLTLRADQFVNIDSREHTVQLFDQPDLPQYKYIDFATSVWFKLRPGDNNIRFHPATGSALQTRLEMCWRASWL